MKVGAVQFVPVLGDRDVNATRILGAIREAAAQGATYIVLPECVLTGPSSIPAGSRVDSLSRFPVPSRNGSSRSPPNSR